MPASHLRPPTPEELKAIKSMESAAPGLGADLANLGCVTMPLFLLGVIICRIFGLLRGQEYWLMLGCLVVGLIFMLRMKATMRKLHPKTKETLATPMVEETTFEITAAIKVEELEDEGSTYYLKLREGGVLFLSGQYLYDVEEDKKFPCTELRTTRSTASHRSLLDLHCAGAYLPPQATLPAFTLEQLESGSVPEDGDILQTPFESLLPNS